MGCGARDGTNASGRSNACGKGGYHNGGGTRISPVDGGVLDIAMRIYHDIMEVTNAIGLSFEGLREQLLEFFEFTSRKRKIQKKR